MRAEPRSDPVELGVGEGQRLGASLFYHDIVKTTLGRRTSDDRQHLMRQVIGDHLRHMRRGRKSHMAAATAEVEQPRSGAPAQQPGKGGQIRPLRMDRALQIGLGAGAELRLDDARLIGPAHDAAPWRATALLAALSTASMEASPLSTSMPTPKTDRPSGSTHST